MITKEFIENMPLKSIINHILKMEVRRMEYEEILAEKKIEIMGLEKEIMELQWNLNKLKSTGPIVGPIKKE
jgi:hypothetical protein